jgi:hypothetical protein
MIVRRESRSATSREHAAVRRRAAVDREDGEGQGDRDERVADP